MKHNIFLPVIILTLISPNIFATTHNVNSNSSSITHKSSEKAHTNAIEIILHDHNHIRKMIAQLDKSLDSNIAQSRSIFEKLKDFLIKHESMEQEIWYPELEKHDTLKDIIGKLKKEEQEASDEIKKLDGITDDKEWVSKVKKLNKEVAHHANEEETKLFPKVRKILNETSLEQIGEKIKEYKNKH
jgi:hemerythrin superfamily protein